MKFLTNFSILFLLLLILLPTISFAQSNPLPELMIGETYLETENTKYYGGNVGNFIVFAEPSNNLGYDDGDLGIGRCSEAIPTTGGYCFILVTGFSRPYKQYIKSNVTAMVSRTVLNNGKGDLSPSFELPALFLNPRTIVGDAYFGGNTDLSNFALWGRNLAQGADLIDSSKGASWMGNNYQINPESQSYWNSVNGGVEFDQYLDKVANLKNDAATVTSTQLNTSPWYLQASGTDFNGDSIMGDAAKYPDGKVWYFKGNINITSNITYYGIGTIIIDGNIVVKKDKSIKAANANSKLGIIVLEQ